MVNETRIIRSVERAMRLLEYIAAAGGQMRLGELSAQTGLHKATLHGLLNTLTALGYVQREGRAYALGLRLREIALPLADRDEYLRRHFRPLLEALHHDSGENVYLAIPCGTREYLYIDVAGDGRYFNGISPRGRREGLTTSAMGKIFLTYIPEMTRSLKRVGRLSEALGKELRQTAERGFALDLGIAEAGLNAFAVPLYLNGAVVAGLSVAGAAERLPETVLTDMAHTAMSAAGAYRTLADTDKV